MGKWSDQFFQRDTLPERCFIFPGSTKRGVVDSILSKFDSKFFHEHSHFERYIVAKNGQEYILIFQAYGAATIIDLLAVLHDGKVREILFIGSAFGFSESLNVGDLILPNSVQALDGIIPFIEDECYSYPHEASLNQIKYKLRSLKYLTGKTVSVPSVTVQPGPELIDKDALALEMECASFLFYSQRYGIKAAAILVISDTPHMKLEDNDGRYKLKMAEIVELLLKSQ